MVGGREMETAIIKPVRAARETGLSTQDDGYLWIQF